MIELLTYDSTYSDEYKEIRFKQELLFEGYREGLEALAQTIQNLILIEPGTYPNQPNLGVGISNYLFEIFDDKTVYEVNKKIENQISEFITHENINVTCSVKKLKDTKTTRANTLSISITLVNMIKDSSTIVLNYLFAGNTRTKKIVSEIYI